MNIPSPILGTLFFLSLTIGACSSDSKTESADAGSDSAGENRELPADTGNAPEGEELFDVSGAATANKVLGVWESPEIERGGITFVQRMRLKANSATLAVSCTAAGVTAIAAATVKAKVSADHLEFLESAQDTRTVSGMECRLNVPKRSLEACAEGGEFMCFAVEGKKLKVYVDSPASSDEYSKVSD